MTEKKSGQVADEPQCWAPFRLGRGEFTLAEGEKKKKKRIDIKDAID